MTLTRAAADPPQAVDPRILDALVARLGDRGPSFRTSLIQTWRDEAAGRLADLAAAATAGDAAGVARVAHAFKSSSASLGAGPLTLTCDEVETRLRAGGAGDLTADAAAITQAVERTGAAFAELWAP